MDFARRQTQILPASIQCCVCFKDCIVLSGQGGCRGGGRVGKNPFCETVKELNGSHRKKSRNRSIKPNRLNRTENEKLSEFPLSANDFLDVFTPIQGVRRRCCHF